MSSSASSSIVRFLRFTTRRKSVKAYFVPRRDTEMGNAGADDHSTCSHGSGNVRSGVISRFPMYGTSKKRAKRRNDVHYPCRPVGLRPIEIPDAVDFREKRRANAVRN